MQEFGNLTSEFENVVPQDVRGRNIHFRASRGNGRSYFIKQLTVGSDAEKLRRFNNEIIASKTVCREQQGIKPLTAIEELSGRYQSKLTLVYPFVDTESMALADSISNQVLLKLGRFVATLDTSQETDEVGVTSPILDPSIMVSKYATPLQIQHANNLSLGELEVIELIQLEFSSLDVPTDLWSRTTEMVRAHGDLRLSQLLVQGETVLLCDWEECGLAPRGYDLDILISDIIATALHKSVLETTARATGTSENLGLSIQRAFDEGFSTGIDRASVVLSGYQERFPTHRINPERISLYMYSYLLSSARSGGGLVGLAGGIASVGYWMLSNVEEWVPKIYRGNWKDLL